MTKEPKLISGPIGIDDESSSLSSVQRKLINLLSSNLTLTQNPYADLAEKLGLSEAVVIETITDMWEKGWIRRLGAVVAHQKSGFAANAMIAWLFEKNLVDQAGETFAQLPYVSHCYRRTPVSGWPFNLYTMIHAQDKTQLLEMAHNMAEMADSQSWRFLESLQEFKKESLQLFI
jgi:DNA-binding Lrp family transcriptional regulator